MRRFAIALALVLAREEDDAADACLQGDDPARLTIENRTGDAFERITMVACDGSAMEEFPLPPPGLLDGDDTTINLPAPGCWLINYDGEGCSAEPSHRTEDVCAGDTHVWTADLDTHACIGG